MKKLISLVIIAALAYAFQQQGGGFSTATDGQQQAGDRLIQQAYEQQRGDLQVQGQGTVSAVLRDDNQGSRHQRFILRLGNGMTVLVAHNIDLAPRVANLKEGDTVAFYGEYEWNDKGGVLHWTHHDPGGRHPHGWLKHNGRTYQ